MIFERNSELQSTARYFRLMAAFARNSFARELAFRANFIVKIVVEILWLAILLIFYRTVFTRTTMVAGWSEGQYLCFLGCYFALEGLLETLFLENCSEFSDLVRSGELDFVLLQPIDEQFMISCRKIDWSTGANVFMGIAVMVLGLRQMPEAISPGRVAGFVALFVCGMVMAYSFLLMLTSGALWFTRNQSLFELWWLFGSLMRYPSEIFRGPWAYPMGWFFSFVVPVLLIVNVPARVLARGLDDFWLIAFTVASAVVLFLFSRAFFRHALQRYRSASS